MDSSEGFVPVEHMDLMKIDLQVLDDWVRAQLLARGHEADVDGIIPRDPIVSSLISLIPLRESAENGDGIFDEIVEAIVVRDDTGMLRVKMKSRSNDQERESLL